MTPAPMSLPAERGGYITGQAERFARCVLLTMKGNSMSPVIDPGQAFLVDETEGYRGPGVYLVEEAAGPVVRKVEPFATPGLLRVSYANSVYQPHDVPLADLRIKGRVVGVIRET